MLLERFGPTCYNRYNGMLLASSATRIVGHLWAACCVCLFDFWNLCSILVNFCDGYDFYRWFRSQSYWRGENFKSRALNYECSPVCSRANTSFFWISLPIAAIEVFTCLFWCKYIVLQPLLIASSSIEWFFRNLRFFFYFTPASSQLLVFHPFFSCL
jgi:hypothetical protein